MTEATTAQSLMSTGQSIMDALANAGHLDACYQNDSCNYWHGEGPSKECAKFAGNSTTEKIAEQILARDRQAETGQIYRGGWGAIDVILHWGPATLPPSCCATPGKC